MPGLSGLNYSSWVPLILVHSIFLHAQREGRVVILSQPLLHRLSFDTMQFLPHYLLEYLTIHLVDLLDRSPLFREWHESDDEVGKEVNQADYFHKADHEVINNATCLRIIG